MLGMALLLAVVSPRCGGKSAAASAGLRNEAATRGFRKPHERPAASPLLCGRQPARDHPEAARPLVAIVRRATKAHHRPGRDTPTARNRPSGPSPHRLLPP